MSPADDRIPVPTNGHHPPLPDAATPEAATPETAAPTRSPSASSAATTPTVDETTGRPAIEVNVTPTQLAVGFGILAGLALIVLGRRRGGRRG